MLHEREQKRFRAFAGNIFDSPFIEYSILQPTAKQAPKLKIITNTYAHFVIKMRIEFSVSFR